MGEDAAHTRGRRKGMTLLRALVATFRRQLVTSGLLLLGDSAVHVAQVRDGPSRLFCSRPSWFQRIAREGRFECRPAPALPFVGMRGGSCHTTTPMHDLRTPPPPSPEALMVQKLRPCMALSTPPHLAALRARCKQRLVGENPTCPAPTL